MTSIDEYYHKRRTRFQRRRTILVKKGTFWMKIWDNFIFFDYFWTDSGPERVWIRPKNGLSLVQKIFTKLNIPRWLQFQCLVQNWYFVIKIFLRIILGQKSNETKSVIYYKTSAFWVCHFPLSLNHRPRSNKNRSFLTLFMALVIFGCGLLAIKYLASWLNDSLNISHPKWYNIVGDEC